MLRSTTITLTQPNEWMDDLDGPLASAKNRGKPQRDSVKRLTPWQITVIDLGTAHAIVHSIGSVHVTFI